jgi:hypothetical protein
MFYLSVLYFTQLTPVEPKQPLEMSNERIIFKQVQAVVSFHQFHISITLYRSLKHQLANSPEIY